MMEINLLPDTYQSSQEAKRLPTLHFLVVAAVLAVIGIAETNRGLHTRDLNNELDAVSVSFSQAQREVQTLSDLTKQLHALEADAALGVSLLYPLSRSRILAEVGRRCPSSVQITKLQASPFQPQKAAPKPAHQPPRRAPAQAPRPAQPSPEQAQTNERQILMAEADQHAQAVIEGKAKRIADVHAYVQRLQEFADVELDTVTNAGKSFQFRMVVTIKSTTEDPTTDGAAQ